MSDEKGFLDVIRANPDDDTTRLVYADWLDERGDIRGEYLRLEHELAQIPLRLAELRQRIPQVRQQIDPAWVAAVSKRHQVVLVSFSPWQKIALIKRILDIRPMGVKEAKDFVETRFGIIKDGLTLLEAEHLPALFEGLAEVAIEPSVGG